VANDYNPNKVAPPEMELLEVSIVNDGYTQPIVTWSEGNGKVEVIDGFHRNRVGKESNLVRQRVLGYLPVVGIHKEQSNKSDRNMLVASIACVHGEVIMTWGTNEEDKVKYKAFNYRWYQCTVISSTGHS